jgi:hypothetical protein
MLITVDGGLIRARFDDVRLTAKPCTNGVYFVEAHSGSGERLVFMIQPSDIERFLDKNGRGARCRDYDIGELAAAVAEAEFRRGVAW